MACQITNNSNLDIDDFEHTIQSLVSFSQDRFGFENPPSLFLNSDPSNASDPLGKTAYYDPESQEIHIYVDERHPKDIMRSISHELIHHVQNLRGDLSGNYYHGEGYAQKDEHMREMEREAYEKGNLCFRDFEDKLKLDKTTYNEWRTNKMSLKEWKNNELFTLLSSKWGFGKNTITEGAKPFDDGDDKDEKCDYVDCDNEKKLGESNCGNHDEKLEEGEDESVISEFGVGTPDPYGDALETAYLKKAARERAIARGEIPPDPEPEPEPPIVRKPLEEEQLDPDKFYLMDGGKVKKGPFNSYEQAEAAMDIGGLQIKSPKPKFSDGKIAADKARAAKFGLEEEELNEEDTLVVDSEKNVPPDEMDELEEDTLKEAIRKRFTRLLK